MLKIVRDAMKAGSTNVSTIKSFLDFEINTFKKLNTEFVEEHLVPKGHLADVCQDAAKRRKSE